MKIAPKFRCLGLAASVSLLLGACSNKEEVEAPAPMQAHEHHAPHGGTAVVLGDEAFHLEIVGVPGESRLTAYVLDDEMENFIRISQLDFEVVANVAGVIQPLTFVAVANPATGETVGDTAQFEVLADWIATTPRFDATLIKIVVKGETFSGVHFNFPDGNEEDEHHDH